MNARAELIHRAEQAATRYAVTDETVRHVTDRLTAQPGRRDPMPYLAGFLTASFLLVAEQHHADCQGPGCPTCAQITDAVAVIQAANRIKTESTLAYIIRRLISPWPR